MPQDVAGQYRTPQNLNARGGIHARYSVNPRGWLPWVFDILLDELPDEARILEAGCGPGSLWAANRDRIPAGWRLTLSGFSEGMVTQARDTLTDAVTEAQYARADVMELPFADGVYDAVIANHMLYHVPDIDWGLEEIRRVLVPGGILFAATNGLNHMKEMYDLINSFDPAVQTDHEGLVSRFCLQSGGEMLRRHFPTVSRIEYPDSLMIDDALPLTEYVCSMAGMGLGVEPVIERRDEFHAFLEARLRERGPFRISKHVGMLIAR